MPCLCYICLWEQVTHASNISEMNADVIPDLWPWRVNEIQNKTKYFEKINHNVISVISTKRGGYYMSQGV